ncbi:MAG: monofunctional glycosyltransferase [Acidobacteriota bacterium]|jgi:monofunctional biosynthetic peptidoglycan transglycosylase|nr:monofunctional glycosyltransferase [Acidobacteriota bacterium]MDT7810024.1 monofunctional glycosyltransferase [Acidobacteriota bacterium]
MWRIIKTGALVVLALFTLFVLYEVVTFPRVSDLQTKNPETTSMIETRLKEAREQGREPRRVQQWVPLERISPNLQRAVLAGEDSNFVVHHGFDYEAIQRAWDEAQKTSEKEAKQEGDEDPSDWIPDLGNFKRGGSTISQQLAKNLYLSSERTAARKIKEAAITYFLERSLSKCRILEIYLNVIEWGDGIYGAEAAAQTYFHKPAANLTPQEAAFLSAMIPSPLNIFNPQKNLRRVQRRQRVILRGMNSVKLPAC